MLNYYDLCNVSPSASQEEIRKSIYQLMRLWSHRTNAPQMERRQEAERMMRLLEEAEEILLDEEKRKEYDEKLRRSIGVIATNTGETSFSSFVDGDAQVDEVTATVEIEHDKEPNHDQEPDVESTEEMIEQVHQLFSLGEIYDALYLAEEITEKVKDHADIWALIGRCCIHLGRYRDAITPFVKACDLEPDNAIYVYELGGVFEELGNQTRALEQYKLASTLEPDNHYYRFKVGILLIQMGQLQEGVSLLEKSYRADPENPEYQVELVKAYMEIAFSNWVTIYSNHPYLPPGNYPIRKSDLSLAEAYLDRASRIPFKDSELRKELQQKKAEIQGRKGRQFAGSWIMAVVSLIFLIFTQAVNPSPINLVFIGLPFLYLLSAYIPKYRIYQKAYQDKSPKTDFAYLFVKLEDRLGTLGAWIISIVLVAGYFWITAFVISIVIIYNFIKNFF